MDCDEPHLALNEKTQPIQWIEQPIGSLVAIGSLQPNFHTPSNLCVASSRISNVILPMTTLCAQRVLKAHTTIQLFWSILCYNQSGDDPWKDLMGTQQHSFKVEGVFFFFFFLSRKKYAKSSCLWASFHPPTPLLVVSIK